ncbi:MAG: hypothetical protein CMQ43_06005 [Gammaproteobacteria bacterium]|nr:hypothetical protein [Gammaproteobacteria bacterium]|tara:strand:+ start:3742 stop:4275 length:534 start_codon:yes stop_codon:yes gene_type:complete
MATPKIYIDSCCFIEVAQEQLGVTQSSEDNRWFTKRLVDAAKAGDVAVYTSLLTQAECLYVNDTSGSKLSSDEVQKLFKSLLSSGRSGVIPIEPSLFVIDAARDLNWVHSLNLRPMDSIHVASARFVGCSELLTLDRKTMLTESRVSALKSLGLRVIEPKDTLLLPPQYRQMDGLDE